MRTIKSGNRIAQLFEEGTWLKTPTVTLIAGPSEEKDGSNAVEEHDLQGRVAFIAGKKSGNAVWRNAAKRRMRAICRDLGGPWRGYEVIFLARRGVTEKPYGDVLLHCRKKIEGFLSAGGAAGKR